jgi:hypothetical protein
MLLLYYFYKRYQEGSVKIISGTVGTKEALHPFNVHQTKRTTVNVSDADPSQEESLVEARYSKGYCTRQESHPGGELGKFCRVVGAVFWLDLEGK